MKQNKLELIVTFAKLWGMTTASDFRGEKEIYRELESYDSEELTNLLSTWADEYLSRENEDTCDFFDEKMSSLVSSIKLSPIEKRYPLLYGRTANGSLAVLHTIKDVANFIIKYGQKSDIIVTQASGEEFISTFGIYINKIADMEYREELLKMLVPMQQAIDGSEKL